MITSQSNTFCASHALIAAAHHTMSHSWQTLFFPVRSLWITLLGCPSLLDYVSVTLLPQTPHCTGCLSHRTGTYFSPSLACSLPCPSNRSQPFHMPLSLSRQQQAPLLRGDPLKSLGLLPLLYACPSFTPERITQLNRPSLPSLFGPGRHHIARWCLGMGVVEVGPPHERPPLIWPQHPREDAPHPLAVTAVLLL